VPVTGAFVKVIFPFNENKLFTQEVGVAVTVEIEQLHAAGAV
jgi:hypothetical protein